MAGATILVVDDDDMNLSMVEFTLSYKPYRIIRASSGMEALLKLCDEKVDLVLLDIEMPIMSGLQTLEIMKGEERFASIPVIFLTAQASIDDVKKAASLGVVDYIVKPFLPQALLSRVERELM